MSHLAVMMYVIRLPGGKWWRRGAGHTGGSPVVRLKDATQYPTKAGAKTAAARLDLEEEYGSYEIVQCARVVGDVVSVSLAKQSDIG